MHSKICSAKLAAILSRRRWVNTLTPKQDGHHFVDGILKCLLFNENVRLSIKISMNIVSSGPVNNNSVIAWRRTGDKPLSEPMMVYFTDAYHSASVNSYNNCCLSRGSFGFATISQIARFMGPTWAHLGPVGPRWVPCWPHEPCYQGYQRVMILTSIPILQVWYDERLSWKPEDYGGIYYVTIDARKVWVPLVGLQNRLVD